MSFIMSISPLERGFITKDYSTRGSVHHHLRHHARGERNGLSGAETHGDSRGGPSLAGGRDTAGDRAWQQAGTRHGEEVRAGGPGVGAARRGATADGGAARA